MREFQKIRIGEEFRPAPQFKKLYYIYLLLAIVFGILTWYIPVLLLAPFTVIIGFLIPILAILIFVSYWIPKYYDTMLYKLTQNEIVWGRGVWFKNTGIVPYNRITNIDIVQGPVSRSFGIASIKIQTAGYSGPSGGGGMLAEIRIEGMEQFTFAPNGYPFKNRDRIQRLGSSHDNKPRTKNRITQRLDQDLRTAAFL